MFFHFRCRQQLESQDHCQPVSVNRYSQMVFVKCLALGMLFLADERMDARNVQAAKSSQLVDRIHFLRLQKTSHQASIVIAITTMNQVSPPHYKEFVMDYLPTKLNQDN